VVTCDKPVPAERPRWAETIESTLGDSGHTLTVISRRPATTLVELIKWIDQQSLELVDVHLKKPTLEDVFIELTGKTLRE
jgi:ABC-2 type transport system ATP-binding protein